MLTPDQQLAMVAQAARAPSAHNIQPARWHFAGDRILLLEDPARWLSVGDPTGRDNQIALGMAWEGMALALSTIGISLSPPETEALPYPPPAAGLRVAASGQLRPGASADPLAAAPDQRRAWRGTFARADAAQFAAMDQCIAAHAGVAMVAELASTAQFAKWHDDAAAAAFHDPAFARELFYWLRLSPRAAGWARDGLSAECMALSRWETMAASVALRPTVVRVLAALSLTGVLAGDGAKVNSAARIVLIHAARDVTDFEVGRRWYRFWLDMASRGIAGVPMSALADSPRHAALLTECQALPAGHRLVNVMRFGPVAGVAIPRSARLPASELLQADGPR
ncbi:hypothetical protein Tamer19_49790 [Cupriavidus sp. TA19]|uniref:hypothetical protein n=1 Tax=unclassified Cupriavidus TaxID=2640874 RepID=UPI0027294CF5|nr:hypothetical protein [Cupriavidus sp. TA19]GLC95570.1 hypothetical protein Tamer19_49790 [Cupriavidus sp. TA19]